MGAQVAACFTRCHSHTRAADSPCHSRGPSVAIHHRRPPSSIARRSSKHWQGCAHVVVASQAPQQHQQQSVVDDTQRSRKFGRFSAKADVRRSLLNFCYEAEVDAGTLVVRPLSTLQLREVTDLLTDVFEASEDPIGLYTRWMRGQIRQYLEHHIKVAPDAVVLVAMLLPRQAGVTASQSSMADASAAQRVSSSGNGSGAGNSADTLSSQQDTVLISEAPTEQQQQQQQEQRRRLEADAGLLVGTVEMSFTDATRTRFLTLNPPTDSAYLGNMCTAPAHRRRGYGNYLLRAAEQLTQLAGYPIIYLHLRFKDTEAAAMYERAGYSEVKRDMFLLPLVGYQRRFLMRKDMPHISRTIRDQRLIVLDINMS